MWTTLLGAKEKFYNYSRNLFSKPCPIHSAWGNRCATGQRSHHIGGRTFFNPVTILCRNWRKILELISHLNAMDCLGKIFTTQTDSWVGHLHFGPLYKLLLLLLMPVNSEECVQNIVYSSRVARAGNPGDGDGNPGVMKMTIQLQSVPSLR